jgi:chromosome partitioning protein
MKTIVLASTKGGSGKSTLAQALAVQAAKEGGVFVADLDPQKSVQRWWERRGSPSNPMLAASELSVTRVLDVIKRRNAERDWLIVDTPGSLLDIVMDAVKHADAVLVVLQPSGKDLEAQGALEEIIEKAGKTDRTLYVINRASKTDKLARDAAEVVAERSALPPVMICNRVDYVRADLSGKTAAETNKDAAKEIAALWASVKRIAK